LEFFPTFQSTFWLNGNCVADINVGAIGAYIEPGYW